VNAFDEIWSVDTEFVARPGERPDPVCLVARELRTGRTITQWRGEFTRGPPFRIDASALVVSFYASAELGTFRALGWPAPARVLDLYAEFRNLRNGLVTPGGNGLLGALAFFGVDHMAADTKDANRDLILRGGPWSGAERATIVEYCSQDVLALGRLLERMAPTIDLPRALLRGRFMTAAAAIEWTGTPIDTETLAPLRARWETIKERLVVAIDQDYGVFEGTTFKADRFAAYLAREDMPWPRLASGRLDLSDDAFGERAKAYPKLAPLQELRHALAQLRLADLAVGSDGRNRCLLSPFRARTSRNQPSASRFVFGPSVWLRSLIKPTEGNAVAYLDFEQQEFAIAAALSGDERMLEAYRSGNPYLGLAKLVGAAPPDATKATHKHVHETFKAVVLGVGYGMEAGSLAMRIGRSELEARELLRRHREAFPRFWQWSQDCVDSALITLSMRTAFGWELHIGPDFNPRAARNFPMQANGAEMLRIALILATERGIKVCAPVHDAVLIEAPIETIEAETTAMAECMRAASRITLAGFELRVEVASVVRFPDRYSDPRGVVMWDRVMRLIKEDTEERRYG
jgi:DNA polymerase I